MDKTRVKSNRLRAVMLMFVTMLALPASLGPFGLASAAEGDLTATLWDPWVLGILTLVAIGFYGLAAKMSMGRGVEFAAAAASVVLFGGTLLSAFGPGTLGGTEPGQLGAAGFEVTASEDTAQSQVVLDQTTNTVQIQMQYDISDANFIGGTQGGEVNFTIGRTDSSTADAIAEAEVISIGLVDDDAGNGDTFPIVAQYADGTFKADWEKGPNAAPVVINDFTTVLVEAGSTAFVRINITLNAEAAGEMTVYDMVSISLRIADQIWTVDCLLTVKQA